MLIGEKWKIESDTLNVTISRRIKSKKGKADSWRPECYVSTLRHALDWLVDQDVRDTHLADLKTIVAKQDELYALIKTVTGKVGG